MYCFKCGASNDDNAWRCLQCGEVLQRAPEAAPSPSPVSIPTYLAQAILCTLFCCWPLGIPAIVYAAQVNGKITRGDIEGAKTASKNAKTWCYAALGGGLLAAAVYLAVMISGVLNR
jgi:hypothetical protein